MAGLYRRHALIEASIEDVWSVVCDPQTHPGWWPELNGVEVGEQGEYTRSARRFGFLDVVDSVWTVEPLEHLREVNFRCTATGTYTRFALTPARDDTFVQLESGVVPIGLQGRVTKVISPVLFPLWLRELLDGLPNAVARAQQRSSPS